MTVPRLCALLLLAAPLTLAQPNASGVVLDPSEAAVPGARVVLTPSAGGRARSATTSVTGAFRFRRLPPGSYKLEVAHEGFEAVATEFTHPTEPLRVVLQIAEFRQEISVDTQTADVNTDPAGNLDVLQLDRRALDELPVLDQDIVGAVSHLLDASSLGTGGPSIVVDGMESRDRLPPPSAIQEVRINQNPYSAEFAGEGRGRIEITTNPGSTNYRGEFVFGFRDHHLDARNAFAVERPVERRRQYGGMFTGPLGRGKKASFMLAGRRQQEDIESVIYAQTPTGLVRENFLNPDRETELSARVNRSWGPNQTVSLRYEFADDNDRGGVGGFRLPEVAVDATGRTHHLFYNHRAVVNPRLILDFQVTAGHHDRANRSHRPGVPRIEVLDAFTGGGAQAALHFTESHVRLAGVLSWSRGRHFVKTGFSVPELGRRGYNDRDEFGGVFSFSSLEDFRLGRPFAYAQKQGESRLVFWQKEVGVFVQDDVKVRADLSLGLGLRFDYQAYLEDHNNLAPRVSFAYSPGGGRRTVLRGGAGFFYDRAPEVSIADVLRFDGQRLRQIFLSNPGYPEPFSRGGAVIVPSSVVRFAPELRTPYRLQRSFSVERQLAKSTTVTASYFGSHAVKVFRSRDANAPLPPLFLRPSPSIGLLRQIESSARRENHSLEVGLRGNLTRFFNGTVRYNLGRARDDTGGIASFPADHYDLSGEWARSGFDERHRFHVMGSLKPGKLFTLGMSLSMHTGRPYSITTGRDENRDTMASDRPAGVRRNSLQGPGSATLALRWSREFALDPAKKDKGPTATVSVDAFNIMNRVNYAGYVGNLSSPFFGQPVAARSARQVQLMFRLRF